MMPNVPFMAVNQEKSKIYGITMMPSRKYAPKEEIAVFGIVHHRIVLRLWYSSAAFLYALWGASHGIASRDFVCRKSPNHSRNRLPLWGLTAPIPREKGV